MNIDSTVTLLKTQFLPLTGTPRVLSARRALAICAWATTTLGWSLLWAEGLGLVAVPAIAAVFIFALGLALIPLAVPRTTPTSSASKTCSQRRSAAQQFLHREN